MFEFPNFRKGTEIIANAIADSEAFSVAGGGDTLAAIDLFGIEDKISYISTGGGAFLEFVEGKNCQRSRCWKSARNSNFGAGRRPCQNVLPSL